MTRSGMRALDHRRLLRAPVDVRPFRGTDLLVRIGGQPVVDRLIDGLYDRIENDAELKPLFSSDLALERARQKLFFAQWLGGEPRYDEVAYSSLKHKHDAIPISRAVAGRWLGHFRRSLAHAVAAEADRELIFERAEAFALALVNADSNTPVSNARRDLPRGSTRAASCALGSPRHPRNRACDLARHGDGEGLSALVKAEPALLRVATHAALVVQTAVLAGERAIVELLLDHGASPNWPAPLPGTSASRLYLAPLCAARWKRRGAVERLLLDRGAKTDVFTAAFLGSIDELHNDLARDESLAQAFDPAGDVLDVTPVHHAVAGGSLEALSVLLERSHGSVVGGTRALSEAAEQKNLGMVELLVARGADATGIGAGRWVLHPELAPLLARAGARVDRSGDWIRLSCTGNQGRKDDPEYVRALLHYGARVDDRRRTGVTATGAAALHYAAKAGFVGTIRVLLEHGADPNALDDEGRTALDWLNLARKSVDRARVRRALESKPERR